MIKITKKFILVMLIAVLTFWSCATIAQAHTREGGENISSVATQVALTQPSSKFNAYSTPVPSSQVEIYNYNSNVRKQCTGSTDVINYTGNEDKVFFEQVDFNNNTKQQLDYSIMFDNSQSTYTNIATIIYRDCITYNGLKYDLKVDLKELTKVDQPLRFDIIIGQRDYSDENRLDPTTYGRYNPNFGMNYEDANFTAAQCHAELKMLFSVLDKDGNLAPVSGYFALPSVCNGKGYFLNNFVCNTSNTSILGTEGNAGSIDNIKYKNYDNGTFIYSTTTTKTSNGNVYIQCEDQSTIELTYVSDGTITDARQTFGFAKSTTNPLYGHIVTKVTGGTITETQENVPIGENRTIEFAPTDVKAQYLEALIVDGVEQEITGNEVSYTFAEINAAHTIEVKYANKNKVTFDTKDGSTAPETQYLLDGENATKPSTDPTKEGYEFLGWRISGAEENYDFTTVVTGDVTLEAAWKKLDSTTEDDKEDDGAAKGKTSDGTEADKVIPQAGATAILFILVIAIFGTIAYSRYKKIK